MPGQSLALLQQKVLTLLATTSDDPLYTPVLLTSYINDAVHQLLDDIQKQNRSYLTKEVLLTPDPATQPSWATAPIMTYTFATQSPPITDFSMYQEIRKTNEDGDLLRESPADLLRDAGNGFFYISGTDDSPVLRLSRDTEQGLNLYLMYTYWPPDMVAGTDFPGGIPVQYQDVIALETAQLIFSLGGESVCPPDQMRQWMNRRAALVAHVGRRGTQPGRTRVDPFESGE
jgi:hypothetical protein